MSGRHIEAGRRGQEEAERFLTEKGLAILERNFRIHSGEIDLIARDGGYVAFVEVKYRGSLRYGYPREAVNYKKQQHIKRVALYYIAQRDLQNCDFRFDVVEVLRTADGRLQVEHIENAFM
jgi:putative endonuclease